MIHNKVIIIKSVILINGTRTKHTLLRCTYRCVTYSCLFNYTIYIMKLFLAGTSIGIFLFYVLINIQNSKIQLKILKRDKLCRHHISFNFNLRLIILDFRNYMLNGITTLVPNYTVFSFQCTYNGMFYVNPQLYLSKSNLERTGIVYD